MEIYYIVKDFSNMKESRFIKQNKEKWAEFENDFRLGLKNPSKLSRLFIQITDDLSFARTFYKNRSVRVYLNGVAQLLFNTINRSRKNILTGFVQFWKTDLPSLMHEARNEFRISAIVFILSVLIGVLSGMHDSDFSRLILGDDYVNMTIENIKNNDPMAVYKKQHHMDMFLGITLNNALVAFKTFVTGILLAVGTLLSLVYNGIMIGAFQYFFIERGLFKESFLTIWQHGTLEISAIIIAGAAGLTLGRGLLFPGTYTRSQSFRISAVRGLKILLGIFPILIFAAFIEGFFTRYTELSDISRLLVILLSLALVIGYYVYYPYRIFRKAGENQRIKEKLTFKPREPLEFSKIKSGSEITGSGFEFLYETGFGIMKFLFFIGIAYGIFFVISNTRFEKRVFYPDFNFLYFTNFFSFKGNLALLSANILGMVLLKTYLFSKLHQKVNENPGKISLESLAKHFKENFLSYAMSAAFLNSLLFLGKWYGTTLFLILLPVFILSSYISFAEEKGIFPATADCFSLLKGSFIKIYGEYIKYLMLTLALLILLTVPFIRSHLNAIFWNFNLEENQLYAVKLFVVTFVFALFLYLFFSMIFISAGLNYYSIKETVSCRDLTKRIKKIGIRTKLFGFERE